MAKEGEASEGSSGRHSPAAGNDGSDRILAGDGARRRPAMELQAVAMLRLWGEAAKLRLDVSMAATTGSEGGSSRHPIKRRPVAASGSGGAGGGGGARRCMSEGEARRTRRRLGRAGARAAHFIGARTASWRGTHAKTATAAPLAVQAVAAVAAVAGWAPLGLRARVGRSGSGPRARPNKIG